MTTDTAGPTEDEKQTMRDCHRRYNYGDRAPHVIAGERAYNAWTHRASYAESLAEFSTRNHERQLCATELLILAERCGGFREAEALRAAARKIGRREVVA